MCVGGGRKRDRKVERNTVDGKEITLTLLHFNLPPGKGYCTSCGINMYTCVAHTNIGCEHLTITIHTSEVCLVVLVQIQHHNNKPLYFEALTNSLFPHLFIFPEFHNLSSQGSAMLSFLLLYVQLLGLLQVSLQRRHIN